MTKKEYIEQLRLDGYSDDFIKGFEHGYQYVIDTTWLIFTAMAITIVFLLGVLI